MGVDNVIRYKISNKYIWVVLCHDTSKLLDTEIKRRIRENINRMEPQKVMSIVFDFIVICVFDKKECADTFYKIFGEVIDEHTVKFNREKEKENEKKEDINTFAKLYETLVDTKLPLY
jgi:CRISPR/Cas system CSM-associated protein Csm2 small subunit